jgi:hypothetical protein
MFHILPLKQTEERDLEHFLVTDTINTSIHLEAMNKYDEFQSLQGQPHT